jgi:hypothetical protein
VRVQKSVERDSVQRLRRGLQRHRRLRLVRCWVRHLPFLLPDVHGVQQLQLTRNGIGQRPHGVLLPLQRGVGRSRLQLLSPELRFHAELHDVRRRLRGLPSLLRVVHGLRLPPAWRGLGKPLLRLFMRMPQLVVREVLRELSRLHQRWSRLLWVRGRVFRTVPQLRVAVELDHIQRVVGWRAA